MFTSYVNDYEHFIFVIFAIVYLHVGVCYCLYFCTLAKKCNTFSMSKQQTAYGQECPQVYWSITL